MELRKKQIVMIAAVVFVVLVGIICIWSIASAQNKSKEQTKTEPSTEYVIGAEIVEDGEEEVLRVFERGYVMEPRKSVLAAEGAKEPYVGSVSENEDEDDNPRTDNTNNNNNNNNNSNRRPVNGGTGNTGGTGNNSTGNTGGTGNNSAGNTGNSGETDNNSSTGDDNSGGGSTQPDDDNSGGDTQPEYPDGGDPEEPENPNFQGGNSGEEDSGNGDSQEIE